MNRIYYHDSRNPASRRPFGAVSCGTTVTLCLATADLADSLEIALRCWSTSVGELLLQPQRRVVEEKPQKQAVYEFELTAPQEPGLVWYHFVLRRGGETIRYGAPADGLGGEGEVYQGIPADWQITVYDAQAKAPDWYVQGIMYQIFPDRFYRGDAATGNPPLPAGAHFHPNWGDWPFYAKDPQTGDIAAYDFFGGTLDGIIDKLDYLKSIGVTMIYLNPVFESVSNHKYDTGDYKKIDAQFGGEAGFERLRQATAAAGIRLILDGVFSHTGADSPYFQSALRSRQSPYFAWYRFSEYPHKYDCWWGVTTMPNVNELEPSYRDFIIRNNDSVIKHWLRKGAAGWRLDVVDELPGEFVQEMYRELKRTDPEAVLIGEVWEDASRKESYGTLRQYLWGRELDSVINYPFRNAVLDYLLGRSDALSAGRQLASLQENYPAPYFYSTMNVLGTHDVPRLLTLLGEAPDESGLTKLEQARYQLPADKRKKGLARLRLAALIQFASPGVPCVYYGDEAGVEGHSDPQNRRTYPWGAEEAGLVEWYRQLAQLRQNEPVLRTGVWQPLQAGPEIYAFARFTRQGRDGLGKLMKDTLAVVLINRSEQRQLCELDLSSLAFGPLQEKFPRQGRMHIPDSHGKLKLVMEPLSGLVLQAGVHALFAERQAGVLLHPTSLAGPFGIGDLGPQAHAFVDWLATAGQKLWQILPLTPVDSTGSPYQSASAFAGSSLLISPEDLLERGWLEKLEIETIPAGISATKVEYGTVTVWKDSLFRLAFSRFRAAGGTSDFAAFCGEAADWLEDYALFMALKQHHGQVAWTQWEQGAAWRSPEALGHYRLLLAEEIEYQKFLQYLFHDQWQRLHRHARQKGIRIVGDLPIFVSHDSADVWANPELFNLDEAGNPRTRAGVPPDYFSSTGQLWGNPHYNWRRHAKEDYAWWVRRLQWLFRSVDAVRIDHFRGFEGFWAIPSQAKNAVQGRWVKGPAEKFFNSLWRQLGPMPIIAEDLGVITPEVVRLKESFFLPGMVIMQFEIWPEEESFHLPEPAPNSFYYTGTHDNDTLLGWLQSVKAQEPALYEGALIYAKKSKRTAVRQLVRPLLAQLLASEARVAVAPLQDWLNLDTRSRMNMPSTASGNWAWRLQGDELTSELAREMAALTQAADR